MGCGKALMQPEGECGLLVNENESDWSWVIGME